MQKLHNQIAQILFVVSNGLEKDYYGVSPDPLRIEGLIKHAKGIFDRDGWKIPSGLRGLSLNDKKLEYLPKFKEINNSLYIADNNIVSLKGRLPEKEIKGFFFCQNNKLNSLEGCSDKVEAFLCANNPLTNLKGGPRKVKQYGCQNCGLTSLEGSPPKVEDSAGSGFDCSNNKLKDLDGGPIKVEPRYDCSNNLLTSLWGSPRVVKGDFICEHNQLTSLDDAPKVIWNDLYCTDNPLVDDYLPEDSQIGGEVISDMFEEDRD